MADQPLRISFISRRLLRYVRLMAWTVRLSSVCRL